jgi:hypothetical protein
MAHITTFGRGKIRTFIHSEGRGVYSLSFEKIILISNPRKVAFTT